MSEEKGLPRVSVVVVGPSGAGKTSLLTSVRTYWTILGRFSVDHFRTVRRDYTAIDFPKNVSLKNFFASGMPQDIVLLVVPVGFVMDPTNNNATEVGLHLRLLALLGATRLVVAVNKMDLVNFQEHEFLQTKQEIQRMLLAAEWPRELVERRTPFVPISALQNHTDNVCTPSTMMPWWEKGKHVGKLRVPLRDTLDSVHLDRADPAMRHALRETSLFADVVAEVVLAYLGTETPSVGFRMPITGYLRVRGVGYVATGYVAQGSIEGWLDRVQFALTKHAFTAMGTGRHRATFAKALSGDHIGVVSTEPFHSTSRWTLSGDCLVRRDDPLSRCSSFTARVSVLGSSIHKMRGLRPTLLRGLRVVRL